MFAPRVLYIAGFPRSGSTVFGDVFGVLPDVFHAGEIVMLGERVRRGGLCSCGEPHHGCEVWGPVLKNSGTRGLTPSRLVDGSWLDVPELRHLLYSQISRITGAETIIDGSKDPAFGSLVAATPGLETDVLHLLRDGRANVQARLRRALRKRRASRARLSISALVDARRWVDVNSAAASLMATCGRSAQARYEDLAVDHGHLSDLRRHFRLPDPTEAGWPAGVQLRSKHTAWGNQQHLNISKPIDLRLDQRWLDEMGYLMFGGVTAIQARSLKRFGYPLRREIPADVGRPPSLAQKT